MRNILPIGTIVLIHKIPSMKFMIVGYFPTNKSGERKDYTAIRYPMGAYDNRLFFFFDEEDISELIYEGYKDNEYEIMRDFIEESEKEKIDK